MATAIATALFLVLVAAPAAFGATQHVVGGASQWNLAVDYNAWAASQTFTIGDTLQFIYGASHSVDVVSQSDYGSCSSSSPIISYTGGNNIITLNSTGTTYFICPTPTHCDAGMKVSITVVAATPTPPGSSPPPPSTPTPSPPPPSTPTPSPPPPPTPNTSSPPPPSTPTNTSYPPPPPPSSASRIFGGKKHLLVEFSLLVIALIGFMG